MSGGVDSSVAAALLVEAGLEVLGLTMKLLPADSAPPSDHLASAAEVARSLGIEHHVLDLHEVFSREVLDPFLCSYLAGTTPNPCALCNPRIKFGALLTHARNLGCLGLATGHYVRKLEHNGRYYLGAPVDRGKDQTYFLYSLTARELARVDFPVGGLSKTEVREKARALGLRVADKAESMETCFVPGRDVRGFVESRAESVGSSALSTGEIRDTSGRVRGTHSGLASYTIGQRKGLGVSSPDPLYVVRLEPERNELVVGGGDEVFVHSIVVGALSWTQAAPCGAPGQAAVFYEGDEVVGGGTILNGGAS